VQLSSRPPQPPSRGSGVARSRDRELTVAGIGVAAAFLALSLIAALGGSGDPWLPLHLALAGGASVAIAAVLPFFAASLVAVAPAGERPRIAAVGLVAAGAAGVTLGWRLGNLGLAALGGATYLVGMAVLLGMTVTLLRRSLGASRRIFQWLYGVAIACVLVGATLTTLMLAGVPAIQAGWATLRVSHAWLNLFGFVGLVIAATLIHFYPTVVGARIGQGRAFVAGIGALAAGPPIVAAGFVVGTWVIVSVGAVLVILGCATLAWYTVDVLRRRARWTTDRDWHRFAIGSLTASIAWLVGAAIAASIVAVARGPGGAGWIGGAVALPLVVGAVMQTIVGSWTHLVPAIGPGDPVRHATQRRVLGRIALPRLLAFQIGTGLLLTDALGWLPGLGGSVGLVLVVAPMAASIVLLGASLWRRPVPVTRAR
jgi:nitrite reductase (NO-forming)